MAECPHAHTVSTTRRNAYSHKWRRSAIPPKGEGYPCHRIGQGTDQTYSAKYIEGLENRLGRMESLLKMSGLLSDEDAGKTDLGTLEKRLAEKVSTNGEPARRESVRPSMASVVQAAPDSQHSTPQRDVHSSPRDSVTTPTSEQEEKRNEEVENLSDMMCSLVTNNCGETRYIGKEEPWYCCFSPLTLPKVHPPASPSSLLRVSNG